MLSEGGAGLIGVSVAAAGNVVGDGGVVVEVVVEVVVVVGATDVVVVCVGTTCGDITVVDVLACFVGCEVVVGGSVSTGVLLEELEEDVLLLDELDDDELLLEELDVVAAATVTVMEMVAVV